MIPPGSGVYGMLHEWYERTLPELAPPGRRWLAKLVCAVVEAGACTQPALATALRRLGLSRATNESLQVGIRRFLSDRRVTVAAAYAPLARAALADWPAERLVLIADTTALKDRLFRLEVALAYHGRTVPLGWAVYPASGIPAGRTWQALFERALDDAAAVLPPGRTVVLLLDRGFVSPAIWDAVRARGWHPVLRAQRSVRLGTPDGVERPVGELLGADVGLVGLVGQVFKKGRWRAASVTALRRDGMAEAWLLVSDLPPGQQRALEYAVRMHIEEGFRDDKSAGWQWAQSRVSDPDRAERLLLVLHLATLWCLSAGGWAVHAGQARRWVRPRRPAWSLFRLGRTWLREALLRPEPLPLHLRLPWVPSWPTPLLGTPAPCAA
jgi:Transposase DDE domain